MGQLRPLDSGAMSCGKNGHDERCILAAANALVCMRQGSGACSHKVGRGVAATLRIGLPGRHMTVIFTEEGG